MAKWLQNGPCGKCGSRDNRAIYDDGSTFCWGCRAYSPPTIPAAAKYERLWKREKVESYINVTLPEDSVDIIPPQAEEWLAKYDLTPIDFSGCQVLYSYEKDLLIWAFYDDAGRLQMFQGRYFGDNPKHPKYYTKGSKNFLHILGPATDTITVVEDICSAAKVGKVTSVMPLFGCSLAFSFIRYLSSNYNSINIWLDFNKSTESLKLRKTLLPNFVEVRSIITPLDPKEYSVDEIKEILK